MKKKTSNTMTLFFSVFLLSTSRGPLVFSSKMQLLRIKVPLLFTGHHQQPIRDGFH